MRGFVQRTGEYMADALHKTPHHSQVVGYSGPPNPLKGLFKAGLAEKAKGSIPGGLGLEGLFLRNHRKPARAVPTPRHRKPPRCGG
jgi:hypothetical protein